MKLRWQGCVVLSLALLLNACSGGGSPAADGGSSGSSGTTGSSGSSGSSGTSGSSCSLIGTWNTTLATTLSGAPITGTTTFDASTLSGSFEVSGVTATATQDYTLAGDQLTMTNSGGTLACPEPDVVANQGPNAGQSFPDVGVYTVAFTGDCRSFTLTLVSDPCSNENLTGQMHRAEDLNGASFSK